MKNVFFSPTYSADNSKPTTDVILICLVLWVKRLMQAPHFLNLCTCFSLSMDYEQKNQNSLGKSAQSLKALRLSWVILGLLGIISFLLFFNIFISIIYQVLLIYWVNYLRLIDLLPHANLRKPHLLPHAKDANLWNFIIEVQIFSSYRSESQKYCDTVIKQKCHFIIYLGLDQLQVCIFMEFCHKRSHPG